MNDIVRDNLMDRQTDRQTDRNNFLDFSRGILIFLVLWGHSIQYLSYGSIDFFEDRVFTVIYSFHMPLFMLLSGYTFFWMCKKRSFQQVVAARVRGLGLPMLSWAVIGCVFSLRTVGSMTLFGFIRYFYGALFKTTWFLWAVLVASLATGAVFFSKKKAKILVFLLAGVLVFILPGETKNLFMIPFFAAGFILNALGLSEYNLRHKTFQTVSIMLWIIMLFFYQKEHYIYVSGILPMYSEHGFWGQIGINVFRDLVGWMGCMAVLSILYSVYQENRVLKYIEKCGRCSLKIYVMQIFLLERLIKAIVQKSVDAFGGNCLTGNIAVFDFGITVLCAVFCCFVLMTISEIISRNSTLHLVLFGKRT